MRQLVDADNLVLHIYYCIVSVYFLNQERMTDMCCRTNAKYFFNLSHSVTTSKIGTVLWF